MGKSFRPQCHSEFWDLQEGGAHADILLVDGNPLEDLTLLFIGINVEVSVARLGWIEHTTWEGESEWEFHQAALHGSSHYDLPVFLRWFTANIGVHHVHHLCSRIPYYRLSNVLREHPELRAINRLSLLESFRCVRLVLWDETQRCLVPFHDRPSPE
jgi:fatty acid desaturase